MRIRGLALLLLLLPTIALATPPTILSPHPIGDLAPIAPSLAGAANLRGAALRDGHLVAWIEAGVRVRIVRLDAARKIAASTSIEFGSIASGDDALLMASDGNETLVVTRHVLNQYPYPPRHTVSHISASLGVSLHGIREGQLRALTWNGTAYVALVANGSAWSAVEMDRRGNVTNEVALSLPFLLGPSDSRWSRLLFSDQGRAWLVGKNVSQLWRVALTDETGHLTAVSAELLPLTLTQQHRLIDAGPTPFGAFLLYDSSFAAETLLQFLHHDGSPDGSPILLSRSFHSPALGHWTPGGVLVFGAVSAEHVIRASRGGCGAEPGKSCLDVQPRSNVLPAFENIEDVVETKNGAIALASKIHEFDGRIWGVPSAAFVGIGPPAKPVRASEPVLLSWDVPDARLLAATPHADGFLVVWNRQGVNGGEIWSQRFDATGGAPSAPNFIARGHAPMVASQGDIALVAWSRAGRIEAVRLDRSGVPIDPAPIAMEQGVLRHVGFDGLQFNIIYVFNAGSGTQLRGASLTPNQAADAAPRITRIYETSPFGFAAFEAVTAPGVTLLAGSTYTAGRAVVALALDLSPKSAPLPLPVLFGATIPVWDGQQFLVTWFHIDHVRSTRVTAAGEVVDSEFGQAIGDFPADTRSFQPGFYRAVADGNRLFVATPRGMTVMQSLHASESAALPGVEPLKCSIAALARRPDGTMLVVYTVMNKALDNYTNSIRAFASVVLP